MTYGTVVLRQPRVAPGTSIVETDNGKLKQRFRLLRRVLKIVCGRSSVFAFGTRTRRVTTHDSGHVIDSRAHFDTRLKCDVPFNTSIQCKSNEGSNAWNRDDAFKLFIKWSFG